MSFDPSNAKILRDQSIPYLRLSWQEKMKLARDHAKNATKLANDYLTPYGYEARVVLYPIRKQVHDTEQEG